MGLNDRPYMDRGEKDPRRTYTADGKTRTQEAQDSVQMLGCGMIYALAFFLIGVGLFLNYCNGGTP